MRDEEIIIRILNNTVYLDEECWKCSSGSPFDHEPDPNCDICKGIGFIPTEVGNGILEFLKRHSKDKK